VVDVLLTLSTMPLKCASLSVAHPFKSYACATKIPLTHIKTSPHCVSLSYNILFYLQDVDADYDNEITSVSQMFVIYELDLGLNHVIRKHAETLAQPANHLITVPGGTDGPSGVIVCGQNYLMYKNIGDQPDIRVSIPRRRVCCCFVVFALFLFQNDLDNTGHGVLIISSATHKTKSMFFFLVQTEQGDIFKVTLDTDEGLVTEMKIKYFDTVPVANSICILKTGFLFVAAEFGNQ
jgi:splicing factor 3B subunit 3